MAEHKIKLQSSDGDIFDVEIEIAKLSITIKMEILIAKLISRQLKQQKK